VLNADGKPKYVYCPGRCHTFVDRHFKMITKHKESMHLPNVAKAECIIAINNMKERAKNNLTEKPRSIIKNCQLNLSDEAAALLSRYSNLVQILGRTRSTKPTYGSNPVDLSTIVIPDPLKYTYNNEYFIWQDSGYGDPERAFIFATEANI
jgi:hypothetical protein